MRLLEDAIREKGLVKDGDVLKVDTFLNHQMDIPLIYELGREFHRLFGDCGVNKIVTIEASGIGIACIAALHFNVPVVFAKKAQSRNIDGGVYSSKIESFTHSRVYDVMVSTKFLSPDDRVLVIDDFLAKGSALVGLIDIINQSGATLVGAGICIEKAFDDGGRIIRDMGVRLESLARVSGMSVEHGVQFVQE